MPSRIRQDSKHHKSSRRRGGSTQPRVPNASTLFRFIIMDVETRDLMAKGTSRFKPLFWLRDRSNVQQIKRAKTVTEVLDLLHLATGLAEEVWQDKLRHFGPEVVPFIADRLKTSGDIRPTNIRDMAVEKLIAALRWQEDAGGQVLLESFDTLSVYGRSLACVVLGLLRMTSGADKMWAYYQQVVRNRGESYFVGALWGLIDLGDERAGEALVELLRKGRNFYELFGFLALAGDARAVTPLALATEQAVEAERTDPMMALLSVGHRIGREALLAEFNKITSPIGPPGSAEAAVDAILSKPASYPGDHFQLFYRRLRASDFDSIF